MNDGAKPVVLTLVPHYLPSYKAGGAMRTLFNMVEALGDRLREDFDADERGAHLLRLARLLIDARERQLLRERMHGASKRVFPTQTIHQPAAITPRAERVRENVRDKIEAVTERDRVRAFEQAPPTPTLSSI